MQPDYPINTLSTTGRQLKAIDLWETAHSLGFPAALWRLPNQQDKHLIVSFDEVLPRVPADLDELPAGFLVSPFDNLSSTAQTNMSANATLELSTSNRALFLRADIQALFSETNGVQSGRVRSDSLTANESTADKFWQTLAAQQNNLAAAQAKQTTVTSFSDPDAQAEYVRNVALAVDAMKRGEIRKVVLSRTKRVLFSDTPNAVDLFDKLCQKYPTAFVSAVSIPEKGQIWISATPERLVSIDANGIFRTASLAGTQSAFEPDGTPKRPPEAMWSQKEIEEQALVSRYIIECFKKIRLREYLEEGPKTLIAGNLMHLSTCFIVDTQAVRYPQLGTVMLRLLHPTSAVCGTPRDVAFTFIGQHETHDRELYSGFLGPVNINTNNEGPESDLFVHIRCMKLEGRLATLYAGAGLTEDSVPEREWQETEMKCQTLLSVINNV
ncbi:chorismate-binding protein [Spirosoma pollinicola]|uniref:isochorismate synthase n=1 Tax=Spirosoma pollinicola TaxID=2057025 RepID=A0A2K8YSP4_9BACT|nr:chorismate-binding protein [Spirosoma pollinicola]AUD00662.1 isochorismate synthase [Spirosoma pollinicola]